MTGQPSLQAIYDELMRLSRQEETLINDVMAFLEMAASYLGYPCIDSDQTEDQFTMEFKRGGLL